MVRQKCLYLSSFSVVIHKVSLQKCFVNCHLIAMNCWNEEKICVTEHESTSVLTAIDISSLKLLFAASSINYCTLYIGEFLI